MASSWQLSSTQGLISNDGYLERDQGNAVFALSPEPQFQTGPATAIFTPLPRIFTVCTNWHCYLGSLVLGHGISKYNPTPLSFTWAQTEICLSRAGFGNDRPLS